MATARSDQYGLAVVAWELLTGAAPFEASRVSDLLRVKLERSLPPLGDRRPDLPDAVGRVLTRAAAVHPDDRYASMAELLAAWREAMALPARAVTTTGTLGFGDATAGGGHVTMASLGLAVTNPYQGLRAFDEGDASRFYGRSSDADALVALVADHRFVTVVGPSGSGKSSLVRAGVAPRLRDGGVLLTALVPGPLPFEELADALLRVSVAPTQPHLVAGLADGAVLAASLDQLLPEGGGELVLVVDQLEELWTLSDAAERDRLLGVLADACDAPGSRLRVLATVRADFFDRPLAHPIVGPLVRMASFAVTPLGAAELEAAIVAPAASVGVRVEPALVVALVADVVAQPAGLPLLQYALTELFDGRDGAVMTRAAYDELGGLAGALARRADAMLDALDDNGRDAVRRLFARLITPGEATEDTRRRARRSELMSFPPALIDAFGAARLLTFDVNPADREPTVEVAHEALIRHWPRLRTWLDEDRDALRALRHLSDSARTWDERGRDTSDLYSGARLQLTDDWELAHPGELADAESRFLAASSAAASRVAGALY